MWILAASESLFASIAAFATLLGVAMTVLSFVANRRNAAEEASSSCHDRLLACQREAERLSDELNELRMK